MKQVVGKIKSYKNSLAIVALSALILVTTGESIRLVFELAQLNAEIGSQYSNQR